MKLDYKQILDNKLSINSYLWPKELAPYKFIESIVKSKINNVGLNTDFIESYGIEKLKEELKFNNINVTSLNSVGYFTDPKYYNQNEKILNYAKILNPELICIITGGINGGPNPLSNEYIVNNSNLKILEVRKESKIKIKKLFEMANQLNLKLGLEPIGSWEILKKGHFNTISSCLKLINNSDHNLIIDLYHSFSDIDLDNFLKKSKKLGLFQFSNVKFDSYDRPFGREDINYPSKPNELNISKYLKYIFNRKDNVKVEFEVFPRDIQNKDPKLMISSLKEKILKLL